MADSFVQYNGDGATKIFAIPFGYLSREHIEVRVDAALLTEGEGQDYVYLSASSIELTVAPGVGTANVDIRRVTPRTIAFVDYEDGATLGETDLDNTTLQLLYICQEAFDNSFGAPENTIPAQAGQSGKFLSTNGLATLWVAFVKSMITDATTFGKNWLGLADAAAGRADLSVYSQAQVDIIESNLQGAISAGDALAVPKAVVDAAGDLIVGTDADTVGRLAKGTDNFFLRVVSGVLTWVDFTMAMISDATAFGRSLLAAADAAASRVLLEVLSTAEADAKYINNSVADAQGDLLVASAADAWARLAKSADGTLFTMVAGSPAWATKPVSRSLICFVPTALLQGGQQRFVGLSLISTSESAVQIPMPACTVKNLRVHTDTATEDPIPVTVKKDGAATDIVATVGDGAQTGSDLVNVATFTAGQLLALFVDGAANSQALSIKASLEVEMP